MLTATAVAPPAAFSSYNAGAVVSPNNKRRHVVEIVIGVDYSAQLKERMKALGITQYALAKEMDLSDSQVSRWFTKDMNPSWDSIQAIEKAIKRIMDRRDVERGTNGGSSEKGNQ